MLRWLAIAGVGVVLVLVMGVLGAEHHTPLSPTDMTHVSAVPTAPYNPETP